MIFISAGKAYRLNSQGQVEESNLLTHGVSAEDWEVVSEVSPSEAKKINDYFGVEAIKNARE